MEYYTAFLTNKVRQHSQLDKSYKYSSKQKVSSAKRLATACYLFFYYKDKNKQIKVYVLEIHTGKNKKKCLLS